jgi:hypothetical protein
MLCVSGDSTGSTKTKISSSVFRLADLIASLMAVPSMAAPARLDCRPMDKNQLYYGDNLDVQRLSACDAAIFAVRFVSFDQLSALQLYARALRL